MKGFKNWILLSNFQIGNFLDSSWDNLVPVLWFTKIRECIIKLTCWPGISIIYNNFTITFYPYGNFIKDNHLNCLQASKSHKYKSRFHKTKDFVSNTRYRTEYNEVERELCIVWYYDPKKNYDWFAFCSQNNDC